MAKIDMTKYKDLPVIGFQPFGEVVIDFTQHAKWDIPPKVAIILTPTGAFVTHAQNPHQPYTPNVGNRTGLNVKTKAMHVG
jgi:hypothetical protein